MTYEQLAIFGILATTLVLFIFGKWRYDIVACLSLLAVALTGAINSNEIFAGFGHPAVITVAAILVITRGLQNSGILDPLTRLIAKSENNPILQLTILMVCVMTISSFINDIGALALVMPVAIQIARNSNRSPSYLLIPLAFGSLLGGLNTMIGTPPNIIISTYRSTYSSTPFSMFDFTPVGIGVSLVGLAYILLIGWRLIPQRKHRSSTDELFQMKEYTSEVRVREGSKIVGKPLSDLEALAKSDLSIIALVRGEKKLLAPLGFETIWANDVLIIEASPESLLNFVQRSQLDLVSKTTEVDIEALLKTEDASLYEAIITPISILIGKSARSLHLRWRYGVNLLAVARHGKRLNERLGMIRLEVGDLLLLQVPYESMNETLSTLGCLPIARKELISNKSSRIILALGIFFTAIALTALEVIPPQVAFTGAAVAMVMCNLITMKQVYGSIEWPVVILIAAMIPVGNAMETTGGAALLSSGIIHMTEEMPPSIILGTLLVIAMCLSNLMNHSAVTVLLAPVAVNIAQQLAVSGDPFLMTVAVGASCSFLTPIGHQSNALVMGPGGYTFSDYWRIGLPLSILVIIVAVPLILWVWPLHP